MYDMNSDYGRKKLMACYEEYEEIRSIVDEYQTQKILFTVIISIYNILLKYLSLIYYYSNKKRRPPQVITDDSIVS